MNSALRVILVSFSLVSHSQAQSQSSAAPSRGLGLEASATAGEVNGYGLGGALLLNNRHQLGLTALWISPSQPAHFAQNLGAGIQYDYYFRPVNSRPLNLSVFATLLYVRTYEEHVYLYNPIGSEIQHRQETELNAVTGAALSLRLHRSAALRVSGGVPFFQTFDHQQKWSFPSSNHEESMGRKGIRSPLFEAPPALQARVTLLLWLHELFVH